MKIILSMILAAFTSVALAVGDHYHGGNVPDWYDPACCNLQDCRPVADTDIDFGLENGKPVVIYKPLGITFDRARWRISKDERFHVCFRPHGNTYTRYCVYLPQGV